ncbi:molybdate ABC transporter, ATP-binding protein [Pseudooceanicola batsensis HTCC2597]|uniref:Molybdate ABC transporter, ATP-binding protein n=1 Tax=Pseudooceanicola batsensis (strain ATCC BAA-863 / DSM 15984 / KCTC 12145 / HTCC2597) TaxID=252305 RepID=A3TTE4_PSEBH|nr:molybdenum ABC transporter ATP-binding protein [Pseudooceanicola batsensis]EAQ04921.1 molybdate ABC transporter, ATP-binding protein [Pseudooceanicola batsensis HTCC2597]
MSLEVAIRHRLGGMELVADFSASAGVTALFGHSGAGKTTVVGAVAGLVRPDAGRIVLDGEVLFDAEAGTDLPVHRRRFGYVFQDARLFPHMTVRRNLLYGAGGDAGLGRVCDLLGIGGLLSRRPGTLSGGEQARVAIGRALLSQPRMLLMDEPFASLDQARKEEILPYLERLRDEAGIPILYVSHAVEEVARLADTLVVLDSGRVVRAGPAAALFADPGLAPALGPRAAGAVIPGRVEAQHEDGLTEVAVSGGRLLLPRIDAGAGAALRIRIAAQDVMLSLSRPERVSALNILPATIAELHPGQGPGVMVQCRCGEDLILARITRRSAEGLALAPGQSCYAVIKSVAVARGDVGQAQIVPPGRV